MAGPLPLHMAPNEAARQCSMALVDVSTWRVHIARKLAKLERVDSERQEAKK